MVVIEEKSLIDNAVNDFINNHTVWLLVGRPIAASCFLIPPPFPLLIKEGEDMLLNFLPFSSYKK